MKKVISAAVALTMSLGLLSGCGNGGAASNSSEGESAYWGEKDPVYIAVPSPLTGDAAQYGVHYKNAAEIYTERINANGGINGRELKVEMFDTKNSATEMTELARQIVEDPKYIASLGDFTTTSNRAALPIFDEAKMVQLAPTASDPTLSEESIYQFQMFGLQSEDAPFVAQYIAKKYLGAKSVACVYFNTDFGISAFTNFKAKAEEIGLNITNEEPINTGDTDFTAILSKIRQSNPDLIYFISNYSEVANAVKQLDDMGWDVPLVPSSSAISSDLVNMAGPDMLEGMLVNQPYVVSPENTKLVEYKEEFEKRAGIGMSYFSLLAYDSMDAIAQAAIRCGDKLNRQTLQAELAKTNIDGMLGQFSYDEVGRVHRKYYICQFQNGEWKAVTDWSYYDE